MNAFPVATPNKNAHIESWHSLLEGKCWRNTVFQTWAEAYTMTAEWVLRENELTLTMFPSNNLLTFSPLEPAFLCPHL